MRSALVLFTYRMVPTRLRSWSQPHRMRRRAVLWGQNPEASEAIGEQIQRLLSWEAPHQWHGQALAWETHRFPMLGVLLEAQYQREPEQVHAHWAGVMHRLAHLPGVQWRDELGEVRGMELRHALANGAALSQQERPVPASLHPWQAHALATQMAWEMHRSLATHAALERRRL